MYALYYKWLYILYFISKDVKETKKLKENKTWLTSGDISTILLQIDLIGCLRVLQEEVTSRCLDTQVWIPQEKFGLRCYCSGF